MPVPYALLGGLAAGGLSYLGSSKAADRAGGADDANIAFQRELSKQQQQNLFPYQQAGGAGLDSYMKRLGYTQQPTALADNKRAMDIVRDFRQQVTGGQQGPARTHIANVAGANTWEDLTDDQILKFLTEGDMNADMERQYGNYRTDLLKMSDEQAWVGDEDVGRFTLEDLVLDPGYQFRLSEGIKNMDLSASAQGMNLSGSTLKGLNRFNQQSASNEFQSAFNRNQTELGNLWGLAGMGQNAAVQQGSNLQNLGQATSDYYTNQGAIGAANAMAPFNAIGAGINTGLGIYGMQNWAGGQQGGQTAGTIGGGRGFLNPVGSASNMNIGL